MSAEINNKEDLKTLNIVRKNINDNFLRFVLTVQIIGIIFYLQKGNTNLSTGVNALQYINFILFFIFLSMLILDIINVFMVSFNMKKYIAVLFFIIILTLLVFIFARNYFTYKFFFNINKFITWFNNNDLSFLIFTTLNIIMCTLVKYFIIKCIDSIKIKIEN